VFPVTLTAVSKPDRATDAVPWISSLNVQANGWYFVNSLNAFRNKCKKLIYLTKEIPSATKIKTIVENNCIIVYPCASVDENVWSFEHFILRMKQFQNTGSYNFT
jgi:hypothetical protein